MKKIILLSWLLCLIVFATQCPYKANGRPVTDFTNPDGSLDMVELSLYLTSEWREPIDEVEPVADPNTTPKCTIPRIKNLPDPNTIMFLHSPEIRKNWLKKEHGWNKQLEGEIEIYDDTGKPIFSDSNKLVRYHWYLPHGADRNDDGLCNYADWAIEVKEGH